MSITFSAWLATSGWQKIIGAEMHQAHMLHQTSGQPARVFAEFSYRTHKSWSCSRRVVAKAEYLDKGENPRFIVTSLTAGEWAAQDLYEKFYCARGEMENRIKEQMCLFADRLSTDEMKGNQLRLYFSALAYTLMEALRRLALKGTEWAQAQVDTIRLKLLKIGAIVRISVRRIRLQTQFGLSLERHIRPRLPRPALLSDADPSANSDSTPSHHRTGGAMCKKTLQTCNKTPSPQTTVTKQPHLQNDPQTTSQPPQSSYESHACEKCGLIDIGQEV